MGWLDEQAKDWKEANEKLKESKKKLEEKKKELIEKGIMDEDGNLKSGKSNSGGGRHGRKYCMICNPDGNGTEGEEGTEAIGTYYLDPREHEPPAGNIPVCEWCAESAERGGFTVNPVNGKEDHEFFKDEEEELTGSDDCDHNWHKTSLVTEDEGYDKMKCSKCGAEGKRYGLGNDSIERI